MADLLTDLFPHTARQPPKLQCANLRYVYRTTHPNGGIWKRILHSTGQEVSSSVTCTFLKRNEKTITRIHFTHRFTYTVRVSTNGSEPINGIGFHVVRLSL